METIERKNTSLYELAFDDFKSFVEGIVGLQNQSFHNDIDDDISNPMHKQTVISFPRDHGKSTHISVAYPLWEIAKNHNVRILLISATGAVSEAFLSQIVGHIDRNENYRAFATYIDPQERGVIPRMKNYAKSRENWSGKSIVIDRPELNLKDSTIEAVGVLGSILSKRADIIICDDIVNQVNSATEGQRLKIIDWIYTTIMPVLVPGGKFIYLGNTWHQEDLVAKLMKDPQFQCKKKMPAILSESIHPELWEQWAGIIIDESLSVEDRHIKAEEFYQLNKVAMDEGTKVLWPTRYPYKNLYLKRLSNPYAFARMYQCDPSNRPDQKFKDEWLERAMKRGALLRLQDEKRTGVEMDITTEGVDLAISESSNSDDCVILSLDKVRYGNELYKTGDYILRNIKRGKWTPNQVKENIKWEYENVKPDGIRVETVGYQEAIQKDLDDMGVPVHGYHTGGEKKDPFIGINSIAILFELGKFVLPYDQKDPRTIQLVAQLVSEMRAFPDGHTGDSLMALWFAFSEARDLLGTKPMIPTPSAGVVKDSPDMSDDFVLMEGNKKADQALILEQQYERSNFQNLMRIRR
jgi:hypothetical protein